MNFIYFSLKLEDVVLQFRDANFLVSSPFNKSAVNELIIQKLSEIDFTPDLKTVSYIVKENQLYLEGMAFEEPKPREFDFIY